MADWVGKWLDGWVGWMVNEVSSGVSNKLIKLNFRHWEDTLTVTLLHSHHKSL